MTNLATRGKTFHRRQVPLAAKETVTFTHGTNSVTITEAVVYETTLNIVGDEGLPLQVTSTEILLPQDAVLIAGSAVKPRNNDQVTLADGTIYEPFKPDRNTPAVVSHAGNEFWLLHTKKWKA